MTTPPQQPPAEPPNRPGVPGAPGNPGSAANPGPQGPGPAAPQYRPPPAGGAPRPGQSAGQPSGTRPPGQAPAAPPARTGDGKQPPPPGFDEHGRVQRTKVSGVWIGLIAAVIVLILLIIFIAQNLNRVGIHFLGFYGRFSLGLALLVAAACGVLIAAVPGTVRILQLRKLLRKNAHLDTKHDPKKGSKHP